jgi:hypothetical protein
VIQLPERFQTIRNLFFWQADSQQCGVHDRAKEGGGRLSAERTSFVHPIVAKI